jgi:hypothetical protein
MTKEGKFVCSIGGMVFDKGLLSDGIRASMTKGHLNYGMNIFICNIQVNILLWS